MLLPFQYTVARAVQKQLCTFLLNALISFIDVFSQVVAIVCTTLQTLHQFCRSHQLVAIAVQKQWFGLLYYKFII